uniref:Uncharacterized protein n=1 Tax=Arundo donax TaxID=35708 RepID=A0A0A9DVZ4_ARUDO
MARSAITSECNPKNSRTAHKVVDITRTSNPTKKNRPFKKISSTGLPRTAQETQILGGFEELASKDPTFLRAAARIWREAAMQQQGTGKLSLSFTWMPPGSNFFSAAAQKTKSPRQERIKEPLVCIFYPFPRDFLNCFSPRAPDQRITHLLASLSAMDLLPPFRFYPSHAHRLSPHTAAPV